MDGWTEQQLWEKSTQKKESVDVQIFGLQKEKQLPNLEYWYARMDACVKGETDNLFDRNLLQVEAKIRWESNQGEANSNETLSQETMRMSKCMQSFEIGSIGLIDGNDQ